MRFLSLFCWAEKIRGRYGMSVVSSLGHVANTLYIRKQMSNLLLWSPNVPIVKDLEFVVLSFFYNCDTVMFGT